MSYPLYLLPNAVYKRIECDLSDYYLIRYIPAHLTEIWDEETNTLKVQCICSPTERIDDLSSSLLGIFQSSDINIEFTQGGKERFMSYCEPDESVDPPNIDEDFTFDADKRFWCVLINNLHHRDFKYTRGNDPFNARCLVVHTPMRWNFWHFSLRWETDLGPLEQLEDKTRKKVAQRIGHSVRSAIAQFASTAVPEHYASLPEECYRKGTDSGQS